jgi:hypothetical protein
MSHRSRHVKCDESRPACRRCVSTGRVCDGYGIWGGGSPNSQPQHNNALSICCTPIPLGNLNSDEQMSFDWFKEKTTKRFVGIFTSDFWETLVFQASAQEPAVRHAVVALSAAHRFDSNCGALITPAAHGFDAEKFTLQQYNKAIHYLRSNPIINNKNNLRVTLITCLVFVTLEYLRGQYKSGNAHLRYGIQLLSELSAHKPEIEPGSTTSFHHNPEDFAHNALNDSYARLTIQCAMFGILPSRMCVMARIPQISTPSRPFNTMVEARQTLDYLVNRIKRLKESYHSAKELGIPIDHAHESSIQSKIKEDLLLWRESYNARPACLYPAADHRDSVGSILLRVYHEMATVMVAVGLSESEMAYDAHTNNFTAIITGFFELWSIWSKFNTQDQHIEEIAKLSDRGGQGFTIESGYIPPVYYTALKCRIPQIRRQAIRTLRSVLHREGVWNGPLLADVLEEVIRIEEGESLGGNYESDAPIEHGGPIDCRWSLPNVGELSRISDVKVILADAMDESWGYNLITYKKKMLDGGWVMFKRKVGAGVSTGRQRHANRGFRKNLDPEMGELNVE